ncbi:MAG: radical SAM protein [Pseudonocardiales bacterium]|nr:radical SAM protein [Pseudonocardiales bacterium]
MLPRGCTNYCSFCPRGHKGTWSGTDPGASPWITRAMAEVFDRYPGVSRTLYLVDEEFIGRGPDAVPRALAVADVLYEAGFEWETSCRIDQVVRLDADRIWHLDRARMWRRLCRQGLRRCLFGVESGVTSILQRFNKETTSAQNVLAIRTLSALGVPTRFTYITFDHLMTAEELQASCAFQNRRDLLLQPMPHLNIEEIVDGVRDENWVATHRTGRPFYTGISYLLVSMECLIGAAYTNQVHAAGLAGAPQPSMGRRDAEFADWRIGRLSHHAQLWVDRHFILDYTLKSLEKLLDGPPRRVVRAARLVLKDAAFELLHTMVALLDHYSLDRPDSASLDAQLIVIMNAFLTRLRARMAGTVIEITPVLHDTDAELLSGEYTRWANTDSWQLINTADPCGT